MLLPTRDVRGTRGPLLLWVAFTLLHLALALLNLYGTPFNPIGDVRVVYLGWAENAIAGSVVGIDLPFVYPILALAPVLAALAFGASSYAATWMLLVLVLNAVALAMLAGPPWRAAAPSDGSGSTRRLAAWWWLLFLAALGPIAIGRIDATTVPLAIVALLLAVRRPVVAAAILTAATWIKVWPAAALAAMLIALRARVSVLATAAIGSAVIVVVALLLGSGSTVFSFLGSQTARGLQIEAPVSTPWLWQAFAGVDGVTVYYDVDILTYQVSGDGTALASALSTPGMAIAFLVVAALGVRAMRRGVDPAILLPVLVLGLVLALIVFNKVGSPQFICWLAAPVVLGIVTTGARFRVSAAVALVLAALTQLIYPYFYDELLAGDPVLLLVLTIRNAVLIALLCWCVVRLWKAGAEESED